MKRTISSFLLSILLTITCINAQNNPPLSLTLPNKEGDVRFLVMGDTGTGSGKQHDLAQVMLRYRQTFPFEFVLMLGGNL